jgi:hypothetical protein
MKGLMAVLWSQHFNKGYDTMARLLVKLHKAVQVEDVKWQTVPLGCVIIDEDNPPWTGHPDGLFIEDIAELFDQDGTGPDSFGTAIYDWSMNAAQVLGVVPTLQYWVCHAAEWDRT